MSIQASVRGIHCGRSGVTKPMMIIFYDSSHMGDDKIKHHGEAFTVVDLAHDDDVLCFKSHGR